MGAWLVATESHRRDPATTRVPGTPYRATRRWPVSEHEQAARKRIGQQLLAAKLNQRVNAFASIHGLKRNQDAHLRRDLQHDLLENKGTNQIY
jgi:hypothetical protein